MESNAPELNGGSNGVHKANRTDWLTSVSCLVCTKKALDSQTWSGCPRSGNGDPP